MTPIAARVLARHIRAGQIWESLSSALSAVPTGTQWVAVSSPIPVYSQSYADGKPRSDKKNPLGWIWRVLGTQGDSGVYLTLLKGAAGEGWSSWKQSRKLKDMVREGTKAFTTHKVPSPAHFPKHYTSVHFPGGKFFPWPGGDITEATLERIPASGGASLDTFTESIDVPEPVADGRKPSHFREGRAATVLAEELQPGMKLLYNTWMRSCALDDRPEYFMDMVVLSVERAGRSIRVNYDYVYVGPPASRVFNRKDVLLRPNAKVDVLL